jgi:SAM-dependent methyltransferase
MLNKAFTLEPGADVMHVPLLPGRLPFMLPDFTRTQWASEEARAVWQPRIKRISQAWQKVEAWSVVDGCRASALQVVRPEQLPAMSEWAGRNGCVVLPLSRQGAGGSYSGSTPAMHANGPWEYRVAIVPAETDVVKAWMSAWATGNDREIGGLLGFPTCCQQFFQAAWVAERGLDTTWQQAMRSEHHRADETDARALDIHTQPIATNLLWRWMGVRLVPHLPCSYDCTDTIGMADNLRDVAIQRGFGQEWDWIEEILMWPVQWSARHGIALIETPILTVSTRTDATADTLTVRRHSEHYPAEGAHGMRFPYQPRAQVIPLTSLRKFKDAFKAHAPVELQGRERVLTLAEADDDTARQNGFGSAEVERIAHDCIAGCVGPEAGTAQSVLDLGCGNGALARRLAGAGFAAGVEIDAGKAIAAALRLDRVVVGSLVQADWPMPPAGRYDVVLLMPGRLLEAGPDAAALVMAQLAGAGRRVLFYAYGDWLERHGSLQKLAKAAGLSAWRPIRSMRISDPMRVEAAIMEL